MFVADDRAYVYMFTYINRQFLLIKTNNISQRNKKRNISEIINCHKFFYGIVYDAEKIK